MSNSTIIDDEALCEDFRCTLIPATRVGECLACGLPFVLSLWLAFRILHGSAYKFDRTNTILTDWRTPLLSRTPFSYESATPVLNRFLNLLIFLPLLFAVFWSGMLWYLLESYYEYKRIPAAVAYSLASLCFILCLSSYGFLHWKSVRFRMTPLTAGSFILIGLIVIALQLVFTLFIHEDPYSVYIVFITFALIPSMLQTYLHHVIATPLTFQQLLRLHGHDPKFEIRCAELQKTLFKVKLGLLVLSTGCLLILTFLLGYNFDLISYGWQIFVAVLFCDFACFIHNSNYRNNKNSKSGGTGGENAHSSILSNPLLLHFLSILTRIILFIAWEKYWFVAVSVNFVIFVVFLIYNIIDRRYPLFSKEDALDNVVGSIESALDEKRMREQAERVEANMEMERILKEEEEREKYRGEGAYGSVAGIAHGVAHGVDEFKMALVEHVPGARFVSDGADALEQGARELVGSIQRRILNWLKSPEFALALLSFIYVAYVMVALYADVKEPSWGEKLFPPYQLSQQHGQYQIGVITFLLLLSISFFFLAFRIYELNSFQWNRKVGWSGLAFLVVSIGGSIGVSTITKSLEIYVYGIYLPLITLTSTLTYCNWRRQDYQWNGWITYQISVWRNMRKANAKEVKEKEAEEEKRKEKEAEEKERRRNGDDEDDEDASLIPHDEQKEDDSDEKSSLTNFLPSFNLDLTKKFTQFTGGFNLNFTSMDTYSCPHDWSLSLHPSQDPRLLFHMMTDFLRLRHTTTDYIIFLSLCSQTLLLIGLGVHLGQYTNELGKSSLIVALISLFIFTIFVLLKWFNTFTVGYIQIIIISGLIIHSSIELHSVREDANIGNNRSNDLAAIGLSVLYPACMLGVMAFYSWKMNNWKISELIKRVLGISCFLILAYLCTIIGMTQSYVEGVIMLVIYFISLYFLILVMVWSSNDFHLPAIYFKSAIIVSSSLILLSLIIILILDKTWFQMVSILFIFVSIALIAYIIQELYHDNATRKLLPSKYIFPVYEYSPKLNEIKIAIRNNGLIALIVLASLFMIWGFIAVLLIDPHYVGWCFVCTGIIMWCTVSSEALFKPLDVFWSNFQSIQDAPGLIDQAREQALESQLGTNETAFEEGEDGVEDDMDGGGPGAAGGGSGAGGRNIQENTEGTAIGSEDDSYKTLKRLQQYWSYEERSDITRLERERAKFILSPRVPEDADIETRARFISSTIAIFDERISKIYEEQQRICVMFQLLINIGAEALIKKNRVRVKDFLRKYIARKMEIQQAKAAGVEIVQTQDNEYDDRYPLINLSQANAIEIQEWAEKNEELKKKAWLYIQELQESGQEAKRKQEEQRQAAVERMKMTQGGGAGSGMGSQVVSAPMTPAAAHRQVVPIAGPTTTTVVVNAASNVATPKNQITKPTTTVATLPQQPSQKQHNLTSLNSHLQIDDFLYRQRRSISFDLENLNIRGPTAESVAKQARAAVQNIIARHASVKKGNREVSKNSNNPALLADEDSFFSDPFFPIVTDLDQLIEAGTDPSDKEKQANTGKEPSLFGKSASMSKKKRKACWKRLHEISKNPKIFANPDKIDPALIIQGDLEDCYLLSALSVIARKPDRIRNLFLVSEVNTYGIYGMTFFVDGEWRAIFVDDQFPWLGTKLAFARSKNPDEFWVPILEKCYAKLYAGYPSIIGGLVHASFQDLTGGITDEVALDAPDSGAFDGRLWLKLFSYYKEGYLMGCGNPKPNAGNFTVVSGIVQGHAYSILDLKEIGDIKLLQLRNPWGEGEWEGDWGDTSDKWTQKMRSICNYQLDSSSDEPDGIFWMSFEDFVVNFQRVYICRVFENIIPLNPQGMIVNSGVETSKIIMPPSNSPSSQPGSIADSAPWYKNAVTSAWRGITAAGHVCHVKKFPDRKPELNPQFSLKLVGARSSIVFLTLTQPTQTGGGSYLFISLLVLKKNGLRAHSVTKHELIAGNTKCRNSREVCAEVSLEPGVTYTLFASTYNPQEESAFTLAAYCRFPVALQLLDTSVGVS